MDSQTSQSTGTAADIYIQADTDQQVATLLSNIQSMSLNNGFPFANVDWYPILRIKLTERQTGILNLAKLVPIAQVQELFKLAPTPISYTSTASSTTATAKP